jgi:two-component system, OmpR family, response regulator
MRLLVVDDDKLLADYIRMALREDGHAVDLAHSGDEGQLLALTNDYDGIVLDFNLPGRTGLEIVQTLRNKGHQVPVLILTTREEKEDIIACLDAGADDYLIKPFQVGELRARLRAITRRTGSAPAQTVTCGNLLLDRPQRRVTVDGKTLPLTPKEYALLEYFLMRSGQVVTRSELLEKVWDMHFDPGSNVIDVHVTRLRGKLNKAGATATIQTVRGAGFMLEAGSG